MIGLVAFDQVLGGSLDARSGEAIGHLAGLADDVYSPTGRAPVLQRRVALQVEARIGTIANCGRGLHAYRP